MTTSQPPTTEQGTERWLVVWPQYSGSYVCRGFATDAVLIKCARGEPISTAMKDPANVLNVSAMPEVVKELEDHVSHCRTCDGGGKIYMGVGAGLGDDSMPCQKCYTARTALALVHPAQEDKR